MGFPPELGFEDVKDSGDVPGSRRPWFLDRADNLTLLDEDLVEALRDETERFERFVRDGPRSSAPRRQHRFPVGRGGTMFFS